MLELAASKLALAWGLEPVELQMKRVVLQQYLDLSQNDHASQSQTRKVCFHNGSFKRITPRSEDLDQLQVIVVTKAKAQHCST